MDPVGMRQRRSDRLAGGGVPEPHRLVPACRRDGLTIGAEGHVEDLALMCQRLADRLAGGGVPEPCRPVGAPRHKRLAIGAEGHGIDRAFMP